jgi:hypothetical protein
MYYLYKKTHNKTGLNYLGYTKTDPYKYLGSGTFWLRHIYVHGKDISTEILKECETKEEIKEVGIYYSRLWNVVSSEHWANLKEEEGNGGDVSYSEVWQTTRKSEEFRNKQAFGAKGNANVRGYKWWYNPITKERKRSLLEHTEPWVNSFGPASEESKIKVGDALRHKSKSKSHIEKLKIACINRPGNAKGTVWVVDENGNRKRVFPDNIPIGYKRVKNG